MVSVLFPSKIYCGVKRLAELGISNYLKFKKKESYILTNQNYIQLFVKTSRSLHKGLYSFALIDSVMLTSKMIFEIKNHFTTILYGRYTAPTLGLQAIR